MAKSHNIKKKEKAKIGINKYVRIHKLEKNGKYGCVIKRKGKK